MSSTVLANVVLARQLVPADFGDFVLLCSIANAASLFAMFGLNSGVVLKVAEPLARGNRRAARRALVLCYRAAAGTTAAVVVLVLLGVSISGSAYLNLANAGRIAVLTGCTVALQAFSNLHAAALRGLGEMRCSSVIGGQGGVVGPLANSLFLITIAALACTVEMSLTWALTAYLMSFGAALAAGTYWVRRTAASALSVDDGLNRGPDDGSPPLHTKVLLVTCFPMMLVQLLAVVAKQGGLWVAGAACTADELALYAGANRAIVLVGIPLSLVNLSVMAFIPQLRTQGRLSELERVLRVAAGWAAIPSLMALLAFVVAPASILGLFLGASYRSASTLLTILSLGQFVLVWVGASELTLVLSGQSRSTAIVNAVCAGAVLLVGPLIFRQSSANGLAAFASAVVAGQGLAQWLLARRKVGVWTHATFCPWRTRDL